MTDPSPIKLALEEAGVEVVDAEPNPKGELEDDEDKVTHAPSLILSRITWIGDQITVVSNSLICGKNHRQYTSAFKVNQ
jgi:hypothetical protein